MSVVGAGCLAQSVAIKASKPAELRGPTAASNAAVLGNDVSSLIVGL